MKKLRSLLLIVLTGLILILPFIYLLWRAYGNKISLFVDKTSLPIRQELKLHAPPLPWLKTQGRYIVNETGEKQVLRGVNVSSINWGKDVWNSKAVEYAVTNWHANVVRTRIFQDEFEQDPEAFFAKIEKQIIRQARKYGVYVILHPWIHNNQPMPDEGTIKMWSAIAEKYKDDPTVIYDVLAEPRGVSREQLRQAYIQLIEAMRQVHPQSLIFVSGLEWGREINSWLSKPLPYENIVYRSNPYNKAGEFESLFGQIAQKYPVFLGEFGADGYPPMSKQSVQDLIDYAQTLNLGWTAWNFSAEGCPCLLTDEKRFIPSKYGEIIKTALEKQKKAPLFETLPQETPEDPQGIYQIYSDYLHYGFIDYSWGTEIDLVSSEAHLTGEKSIKASLYEAQAGVYFNSSLAMPKEYQTLSLWIKTGEDKEDNQDTGDKREDREESLEIYLKDNQDVLSKKVSIADYLVKQDNQWQQVVVPLDQLDFVDKSITGIFIAKKSASPIITIYIDQIQMEE